MGRRQGMARMAHLFCEMYIRLGLVGLVDGGRYELPLSQLELGECLGMTAVHANRTLQQLRDSGTVEFREGTVSVCDFQALADIADFRPDYLYLKPPPL